MKLVIYGAGDNGSRFAYEHRDLGKHNEFDLVGFVDDYKQGEFAGLPILGKKDDLPGLRSKNIENILVTLLYEPVERLEKCLEIERMGFNFPSFHPYVPRETRIGRGVYIDDKAALLGSDQEIGDFSVIGPYATLEGRAKLGKGVVLCPYSFIGYGSEIGNGTVFYPRSTALPHTKVGENCVVGPNVMVRKKVEDHKKNLRFEKLVTV